MEQDKRGSGWKGKGKAKPLQVYDTLSKVNQDETTSHWQGTRGHYVFEDTKESLPKRPIRKVYRDRVYLTGLFRSRKPGEYLGDIKGPEGKQYLLFRVKGESLIEIYSRQAVSA